MTVIVDKLQGNLAFSNELARRFAEKGIISNALNPGRTCDWFAALREPFLILVRPRLSTGNLKTDMQRHATAWQRFIRASLYLHSPDFGTLRFDGRTRRLSDGHLLFRLKSFVLYPVAPLGALTPLYVGTSPETGHTNGGWFVPWARQWKHSAETQDLVLEAELWDWIEEQRKEHC